MTLSELCAVGLGVPGIKVVQADLETADSIVKVATEVNPNRIFINKWLSSKSVADESKLKHRAARLHKIQEALMSTNIANLEEVNGPFWPWWKPSMS